jgi:phosphocarrier protein HPr
MSDVFSRQLPVINMRGLHARASAKFVKTVESFEANVTVSKDGAEVGGTSIMGLMMLNAGPGSTIHVAASGPQARAVLDALDALLADRFQEGE